MNKLSKTLLALTLSTLALGVNAQSTKNVFVERTDFVQKYTVAQPITISWYIGGVEVSEFKDLIDRYLSFSNYLTTKLDHLVVIDTTPNDLKAGNEAIKGNYDLVYTTALISGQLAEAGWKPIVARTENTNLVVVALASNKLINSEKDFKNTLIITTNGSSLARTIGYSLIQNKFIENAPLKENKNFKPRPVGQEQLVDVLKNKQTDGILIRDTLAKKIMDASPGQYKIVYKAPSVLGGVLLASPNFDNAKLEVVRRAFKGLDNLDRTDPVLKAIDGLGVNNIFKDVPLDELKSANELSHVTEENKITGK